jgi:transcriptional regulator with XRE-family HTH domain
MTQGETPVVSMRRLQAELRRFRDEAGLTQKSVAIEMGWSTSKVVRMETGTVNISPSDLRALLHFYGIDDAGRTEDLLAITRQKGESWWDGEYPENKQFRNFLAFEDSAVSICQFMGLVVPGLLQTEKYMRAIFTDYMLNKHDIERGVRNRLRRQELLSRDGGPKIFVVLDEAVIHRWVGGPDVMSEQLTRLQKEMDRPNIDLRIIPFAMGVHRGMRDSFTIFELPPHEYVVNVENPHRDVLISNDPDASKRYVDTFQQLQGIADKEISKLIDPVIDKMGVAARA